MHDRLRKHKIIFYTSILLKRYIDKERMFLNTFLLQRDIDKKLQEGANKALDNCLEITEEIYEIFSDTVDYFELQPIKYFSSHQGVAIPVYEFYGIRFLGKGQIDYKGPVEKINPAEIIDFLSKADYDRLYDECFEYFLENGINDEEDKRMFHVLKGTYEGTLFKE